MKQISIAIAAFLLAISISNSTSAHSGFKKSNPADGETITNPLNAIVLEFDGQIEQGSLIEVTTTSGQAVEIEEIIMGEGSLTGTFAEPLPDDNYQVNWSIISVDGHPLEGGFSFTVNAPVSEKTPEPVTEERAETTEADNITLESENQAHAEEDSTSMPIMFILLLIVMILGGIFTFNKRKRK